MKHQTNKSVECTKSHKLCVCVCACYVTIAVKKFCVWQSTVNNLLTFPSKGMQVLQKPATCPGSSIQVSCVTTT